jgi:hypothetical protein
MSALIRFENSVVNEIYDYVTTAAMRFENILHIKETDAYDLTQSAMNMLIDLKISELDGRLGICSESFSFVSELYGLGWFSLDEDIHYVVNYFEEVWNQIRDITVESRRKGLDNPKFLIGNKKLHEYYLCLGEDTETMRSQLKDHFKPYVNPRRLSCIPY